MPRDDRAAIAQSAAGATMGLLERLQERASYHHRAAARGDELSDSDRLTGTLIEEAVTAIQGLSGAQKASKVVCEATGNLGRRFTPKFEEGQVVRKTSGGEWMGMEIGDEGRIISVKPTPNNWCQLLIDGFDGVYSDFNFTAVLSPSVERSWPRKMEWVGEDTDYACQAVTSIGVYKVVGCYWWYDELSGHPKRADNTAAAKLAAEADFEVRVAGAPGPDDVSVVRDASIEPICAGLPMAIGSQLIGRFERESVISAMSLELEQSDAFRGEPVKAIVWAGRLYDAILGPILENNGKGDIPNG